MKTLVKKISNWFFFVRFMTFCIVEPTTHGGVPRTIIHHLICCLRWPSRINDVLEKCYGIITAMTGNHYFPAALPGMVDLKSATDDLKQAEDNVKAKLPASVPDRNNKLQVCKDLFFLERNYVQSVMDANRLEALTIARSAMLDVKHVKPRVPNTFKMRGLNSGSIKLTGSIRGVTGDTVKPSRKGFHEWHITYTPDDDKSWDTLKVLSTTKATQRVYNLNSCQRIYGRHRYISTRGASDWDYDNCIVP